ncbi:hypothetical protein GCM10010407_18940 [Rarobacter incanus]
MTVDVAQLVSAGWLAPGARLRNCQMKDEFPAALATVAQDGRLHVDGRAYDTPSGAAHAYTQRSINGWFWWAVEGTGKSLADLRSDYLASLGADD